MIIKNSYGIILFRIVDSHDSENRIQVLVAQRRTTYAFNEFALGIYGKNNTARLMELFNGMTAFEKSIVMSCNFQLIWRYFRLTRDDYDDQYIILKNKFESCFLNDNGAELKRLINESSISVLLYEFPKGRPLQNDEPPINCAVREFAEESGIEKSKYKLIPDVNRTLTTMTRYGSIDIKYVMKYYVAIANYTFDVNINFRNKEQLFEIGDIKWVSLSDLKRMDNNNLVSLAEPLFNYVKKHY